LPGRTRTGRDVTGSLACVKATCPKQLTMWERVQIHSALNVGLPLRNFKAQGYERRFKANDRGRRQSPALTDLEADLMRYVISASNRI
jgi:hypothetical protein